MSSRRRTPWQKEKEVQLLEFWKHNKKAMGKGRKRKEVIYEKIASEMGAPYTGSIVRVKLLNWVQKYRKERLEISNGKSSSWEYYNQMHEILGSFPLGRENFEVMDEDNAVKPTDWPNCDGTPSPVEMKYSSPSFFPNSGQDNGNGEIAIQPAPENDKNINSTAEDENIGHGTPSPVEMKYSGPLFFPNSGQGNENGEIAIQPVQENDPNINSTTENEKNRHGTPSPAGMKYSGPPFFSNSGQDNENGEIAMQPAPAGDPNIDSIAENKNIKREAETTYLTTCPSTQIPGEAFSSSFGFLSSVQANQTCDSPTPPINQSNSHDKESYSNNPAEGRTINGPLLDGTKKYWTVNDELALIDAWEQHLGELRTGVRKTAIFTKISVAMGSKYSPREINIKINNIMQRYKKENNHLLLNTTNRPKWMYYDRIHKMQSYDKLENILTNGNVENNFEDKLSSRLKGLNSESSEDTGVSPSTSNSNKHENNIAEVVIELLQCQTKIFKMLSAEQLQQMQSTVDINTNLVQVMKDSVKEQREIYNDILELSKAPPESR